MLVKTGMAIAALVTASGSAAAQDVTQAAAADSFVTHYLDAFNAHDVDRLRAYWAEDIEWVALDDGEMTTLVSSASALDAFMTQYFAEHSDVRSEAGQQVRSGSFVAFVETAIWTNQSGSHTQEALAIYQLEDGRIARFLYLGEPE